MKLITLLTLIVTFNGAYANQDLQLPGERWLSTHTGYLCGAFTEVVTSPQSHSGLNIQFEKLSTDRSLDNALITATFTEDNTQCRYSAILLADNAAGTVGLVESKAYSLSGQSDCLVGQELIDNQLIANDYLYWGHPHHVTIMVEDSSAATICGEGSTHIGIDFTVSGIIRN